MNAAQAKRIPLIDLLSSLGFSPSDTRKSGNEVWYCSPFRKEGEPSFKIRIDQNVWYDFGEGVGGNILDFVMKYNRCDFSGALSFLDINQIRPSSIRIRASNDYTEPTLNLFDGKSPLILEIKPVFHFALKEYLKGRCISAEVGMKHLKEIHYKVEDKEYFALGFANVSNGWETRNSFFKGCLGKKDISLIETGSDQVSAFEGFMDFLSYLTVNQCKDIGTDVLVLNSTSMKGRGIEFIKEKGYKSINTYFDNDKSGLATHNLFCKEFSNLQITPKNSLYMPYKDFNDFLKSKTIKQLA